MVGKAYMSAEGIAQLAQQIKASKERIALARAKRAEREQITPLVVALKFQGWTDSAIAELASDTEGNTQ